ncbi:thymidine phosphorylase [Lysinibacillus sphaericus]|uniref:Pyrimidine-nucleoside phosphorylase n=1 Tax=Lysinibacillus sphaericus TaxID=1421 RepID=A0A2S0K364_LYSSH|nr:thymidine phosphorylase [Lysinibacillus sphaericus]AVK97807.1 thymidine phosphorylase [Lysinibacillus sphaericus]MED4543295.1 thymidine phosphorylase [Lysinibacillus sphaericus]TKI21040.1 thymidine phosphorylase [Lysinibacillus sphaericus]SUV16267.1 pyrimidine-nucleoside phosphorylase [Lysinibacillus sphaericus]GEC81874.1 pyrimidine-nucleoside phosphorylase [Lysinibacillus sphaericus]
MNMVQLFEKKKQGKELTQAEIQYFVEGYTTGAIPDYQASALLMAIRLLGMTDEETFYLTKAMIESGDVIDLTSIEGFKIDKHSTGGVGDKVTLIVTPIIASLDIPVAKFSGKGLGITGGTIDKLESIRGFKTELSSQEFIDNVNKHKIAVAGQTGNLVPADKKLYALRDVTGTVDSIPLIAASIMSKKIASGADGIVLDVKCGSGAFMKTEEEAKKLAEAMTAIGEKLGRKVVAHISDMDNPLGKMIGNKLEVVEAYALLKGRLEETHADLLEECIIISSLMYQIAAGVDETTAVAAVKKVLEDGSAAAKFEEFIVAQGGDLADIVQNDTAHKVAVKAAAEGVVASINALMIGEASVSLGAGRLTKESSLDYDAGIQLVAKKGDRVSADETIAYLYSNSEINEETITKVQQAYLMA